MSRCLADDLFLLHQSWGSNLKETPVPLGHAGTCFGEKGTFLSRKGEIMQKWLDSLGVFHAEKLRPRKEQEQDRQLKYWKNWYVKEAEIFQCLSLKYKASREHNHHAINTPKKSIIL